MPEWSQMVKYYALEPEHLPVPHGPNVVVIEGVDTEEFVDPQTRQPMTRHRLLLAGWEHPLRLNNMRIKVLQGMFGPRVEDSIGKKIALLVAASQSYGEVKPAINIHPYAPGDAADPVPVPHHLATRNPHRLAFATQAGVSIGKAAPALPNRPAAIQPSGKSLGPDAAAELCLLLRERGRDWQWLIAHFRRHGMESLVSADLPPDCDAALRAPAWGVLKDLAVTVRIDDRAAAKSRLIASWSGEAAPAMTPDERDANEDDIPF